VNQTNHFIDLGYGWLCKHCSADDAEARRRPRGGLFGGGDAAKQEPKSFLLALASWTDASRNALFCPRCGIHETIKV